MTKLNLTKRKRIFILLLLIYSGVGIAYDLHIESSGKTLEQWKSYVESSPLLISSPKAEATNPRTGEVISIDTPNAAKSDNGLYFSPNKMSIGLVITISNPNDSDIPLLKKVTKEFGGTLIGDEGEEY